MWTRPELLCHHDGMRTTLDIDDHLLEALLARHPGVSKREAVERAIAEYLSKDAAARTMALRGSLDIEDASVDMRRTDRRT
jgi:hypothetical protein